MNASRGSSEMKTDCLFVARDRVAAGRPKGGYPQVAGVQPPAERYSKKCRTECWHCRLGMGRKIRVAILLLWWGGRRRGPGCK